MVAADVEVLHGPDFPKHLLRVHAQIGCSAVCANGASSRWPAGGFQVKGLPVTPQAMLAMSHPTMPLHVTPQMPGSTCQTLYSMLWCCRLL